MRIIIGLLAISLYAADPRTVWRGPDVSLLGSSSPDGAFISYVDRGELAIRDLRANTSRRLTQRVEGSQEFAYFSVISPDGKQVAFAWFNSEGFYDLRVIDIDGGSPRILYRNEEAGFVQPCAWSPDGKSLLTLLFRRDNISQIALAPIDGRPPRILRSLNWVYPKKMDFSPDGRFVAYDGPSAEGSGGRSIFVLAIDGSRENRLADGLFPVWTRDGNRIIFTRGNDLWALPVEHGSAAGQPSILRRDIGRALPMGATAGGDLIYGIRTGKSDVFVAELSSPVKTARRATIRFPGLNSRPAFSPDGKWLAYLSRRGSENYGLEARVIVLRSMEEDIEREIAPKLAHIERVSWSRDGAFLLVSGSGSNGRAGLYKVSLITSEMTTVADEAGADYRGVDGILQPNGEAIVGHAGEHLAVSPDGKAVAVADSKKVRVKTREIAFAGATELHWGNELLAARGSEIWVLGDPPRKLDMPSNLLPGFSLHPDGKRIALTAGDESSEVLALPLDSVQVPTGLDMYLPVPESNAITRAKVDLGRKLFFDKRLSQDGTISCSSCHDPQRFFTDARAVAIGVRGQKGTRRTPRIANRVYGKSFFWDGRAKSLEEQVLQPIENPKEMALAPVEAAARAGLDVTTMQQALASYVRTILSGDSPYDRYVLNGESTLTELEKHGLRLFRGKAGCAVCHLGPNFSDEKLHNTGLGKPDGAFKTPSLRDSARTPPYMHDGSLATLEDVIAYYDKGGNRNPNLDPEIRPLSLTAEERKAIIAFLSALNGVIREGM